MKNIRGLDTETMGLDPHTKPLLSVQIGTKDIQIVIDCLTIDINLYKEILEDKDVLYILANAKFDIQFFFKHNIVLNKVWDVMLAEQILYLGYPKGSYHADLKTLEYKYLNKSMDKSVRGKIIKVGLTEEVIVYAANDVIDLEDLMDAQIKALEKEDLVKAAQLENRFVIPMAYMEWCGMKLDVVAWKKKMAKDRANLDKATKELNDWVVNKYGKKSKFTKVDTQGDLFTGYNTNPQCIINWNSADQVIPLFKDLGINTMTIDKKTKKVKDSVEAKLMSPQKSQFPILPIYLRYKEAAKVCSTYGQNWLNQVQENGRIYTKFHQLGTNTARISSGGKDKNAKVEYVNFLNLPSDAETRACFIAEKGNSWISIDYSGQESFIMASISNDKALIHELMEGSGDLHSLTAYMSYPNLIPRDTPINKIKENYHHLRQLAKKIEFGFNYGGDYNTIHQNLGISIEEAKEIYENYMKGFSGLAKYQEYCRKIVMEKGYILLNPISKYRSHIYDFESLNSMQEKMKDKDFWRYYREMKREAPNCDTVQEVKDFFRKKGECERNSINYRIQHTGALCYKVSMIYFFKWIIENNLFNKVLITVTPYDELNCEAPTEIAEKVAKQLHAIMVRAGEIFCTRCKLDADISKCMICIEDYKDIMKKGDILLEADEKYLINESTHKKYLLKDLDKEYKKYISKNGPLPTHWVH